MNRPLLSAAVGGTLAALALPLAAGGQSRELTIGAQPNPVLWADTVTISGHLSIGNNAGRTVELQHDPYPFGGDYEPGPIARTSTDSNGDYSFSISPPRNTNYRAVTTSGPEAVSDNLFVMVRRRITRRVTDRTPRRGQRVTFYGAVAPQHDGGTIRIQRKAKDGSFDTVAETKLTDAGRRYPTNSFYERRLKITRDGTYRVEVRGDAERLRNWSRQIRLDVR